MSEFTEIAEIVGEAERRLKNQSQSIAQYQQERKGLLAQLNQQADTITVLQHQVTQLRVEHERVTRKLLESVTRNAMLSTNPPILVAPKRTATKLRIFGNGSIQVCYDDGTNSSLRASEAFA